MRSALSTAVSAKMKRDIAKVVPASGLTWLTTAFLISIALPSDIEPSAGAILLPPYRVVCLVAAFIVLPRFFRGLRFKWNAADAFVLFLAVWQSVCHLVNEKSDTAWQAAGSAFLDCVAYFIARVAVTDIGALTSVARVTTAIVFVILPFTACEAIFRRHFVHELMGARQVPTLYDIRLGLLRAMGPFEHSIMYGTFCASALSLSWFLLPLRFRALRTIAIGVAIFVSVSTAPMLAGALQLALTLWDRVFEKLRSRWTILSFGLIAALVLVSLVSNRPLTHLLISYLTLVPATGWNRLAQWTYGWADAQQNWIFGLGYKDWPRPFWLQPRIASVDSYWLHRAIMFGMPGFYASILATIAAVFLVAKSKLPEFDPQFQRARKAWMFSIVALSVVGITVDYWHQMNAYYFFVLGSGLWLADPKAMRGSTALAPRRAKLLE